MSFLSIGFGFRREAHLYISIHTIKTYFIESFLRCERELIGKFNNIYKF